MSGRVDDLVARQLARAIERIMGVGIEQMGGDNLAVLLCSHFDDPDDGSDMDDTGWSETATTAYEAIKHEIEAVFVPVMEAIAQAKAAHTDEIERLRARVAELEATVNEMAGV